MPLGSVRCHGNRRTPLANSDAACAPWALGRCLHLRRGPAAPHGVSHSIIEALVDGPYSPFHCLGLGPHQTAGDYERTERRQVNQLRQLKRDPAALGVRQAPDWPALFEDPTLPLVADLGCGAGRFLLLMATRQGTCQTVAPPPQHPQQQQQPQQPVPPPTQPGSEGTARADLGAPSSATGRCNFLGVDVRMALASRANAWSAMCGLSGSVRFLAGNATVSVPQLLGSYPGPVALVALQFSDPPYRRQALLQEQMAEQLAACLKPGGLVWVQTDRLDVAVAIRRVFWAQGAFAPSARHATASSRTTTCHWWRGELLPEARGREPAPAHLRSRTVDDELAAVQQDEERGAPPGAAVRDAMGSSAVSGSNGRASADGLTVTAPARLAAAPAQVQPSGLPLLLADADLARHREPWLIQQKVDELQLVRRRRGANGMDARSSSCDGDSGSSDPGQVFGNASTGSSSSVAGKPASPRRSGGAAAAAAAGLRGHRGTCGCAVHAVGEADAAPAESSRRGSAEGFLQAGGGSERAGASLPGHDDEHTESSSIAVERATGLRAVPADLVYEEAGQQAAEPAAGPDGWSGLPWLDANPCGVPTEREVYVERGARPIYRLLLVRKPG